MARLHDPRDWNSPFSSAGHLEFQRNRGMRSQRYGNPLFLREEGNNQGVYGFSADLYCPCCNAHFDFILVEFEDASVESSLAWGEINLEEFEVDVLQCPSCGYRDLEPL